MVGDRGLPWVTPHLALKVRPKYPGALQYEFPPYQQFTISRTAFGLTPASTIIPMHLSLSVPVHCVAGLPQVNKYAVQRGLFDEGKLLDTLCLHDPSPAPTLHPTPM